MKYSYLKYALFTITVKVGVWFLHTSWKTLFLAFERLFNFSLFSGLCVNGNTRQEKKVENAIKT